MNSKQQIFSTLPTTSLQSKSQTFWFKVSRKKIGKSKPEFLSAQNVQPSFVRNTRSMRLNQRASTVTRKYAAQSLPRVRKSACRIMIVLLIILASIASFFGVFDQNMDTFQEFLLAGLTPEFLLTSYRRPFYNARLIWFNKSPCTV